MRGEAYAYKTVLPANPLLPELLSSFGKKARKGSSRHFRTKILVLVLLHTPFPSPAASSSFLWDELRRKCCFVVVYILVTKE